MGLSKVALVGMGCQTSVTGAMEARRVNKWRKKIAWTFGLLCSKSFSYDGLMVQIAQEELGLDLDHLARVNIKGRLLFYTDTGDEIAYPLKDAHRFTRPGCLRCPDFAAEHADISFGGLGQSDGWTLTIVRTERGQAIWDDAVAEDIVEHRPATEDPKASRRCSGSPRNRGSGGRRPARSSAPARRPGSRARRRRRPPDRCHPPRGGLHPAPLPPILRRDPARGCCRALRCKEDLGRWWIRRGRRGDRARASQRDHRCRGLRRRTAPPRPRLARRGAGGPRPAGRAPPTSRAPTSSRAAPARTGRRSTRWREWCAPGIASQASNPALAGASWTEIGFERWAAVLSEGGVIDGDVGTFPAAERDELAAQDIASTLVLPIRADGEWWGCVGFDECVRDPRLGRRRDRGHARGGRAPRRRADAAAPGRSPAPRRGALPERRRADPRRDVLRRRRRGGGRTSAS